MVSFLSSVFLSPVSNLHFRFFIHCIRQIICNPLTESPVPLLSCVNRMYYSLSVSAGCSAEAVVHHGFITAGLIVLNYVALNVIRVLLCSGLTRIMYKVIILSSSLLSALSHTSLLSLTLSLFSLLSHTLLSLSLSLTLALTLSLFSLLSHTLLSSLSLTLSLFSLLSHTLLSLSSVESFLAGASRGLVLIHW